jgi:hypothetical protein
VIGEFVFEMSSLVKGLINLLSFFSV